jgi:acid phosphatase type 7
MAAQRPGGVLAVVALVACSGNQVGDLAASRVGDIERPAARGSPIDELRRACGDGASTAAAIQRAPYLQQVTLDSAMIGWVTRSPAGQRVVVTTPDGGPLTTVDATIDRSSAGRRDLQMWARITGLVPDTVYCYSIADRRQVLSAPTGFRTAPLPDSAEPVRFLAFGDSGYGGADQRALLAQMYEFPFDLVIHTGDLAYDDGTLEELEANVFGVYRELFRNVSFFPVPGNHDYRTDRAAPFREVFALPGNSGERWYSFDWGRVHFAALDTEQDYATQAAWLDRDLARTTRPWKIVYMHKAPYSSSDHHGSDLTLRAAIAPVVRKHGVQLVLSGHEHHYERTRPQDGVVFVITGGGGRGTRPVGSSGFTAFSDSVIHLVYVEVGLDELTLHAIDATGVEFDSMVIRRDAGYPGRE